MRIAKTISWVGAAAMTVALFYGFTQGDFFTDGSIILNNPWGIVSLVDLYVGFILFSMWIFFREKNKLLALIWIVSMMVLGFFAGSLYVALHLEKSKGSWERFFLGWRSNKA